MTTVTFLPTSDRTNGFNRSQGSHNWENVVTPDDGRYNYKEGDCNSSVGIAIPDEDSGVYRDEFGFTPPSIPSNAINIKVALFLKTKRAVPNSFLSYVMICVGNWHHSFEFLIETYALYSHVWAVNPETLQAWTADQVNGIGNFALKPWMIYGLETGEQNIGMYVDHFYMEISYD